MIQDGIWLLALAAAVHLLYTFSVFDIYFRSPIDQGIPQVKFPDDAKPPAKRLVLFVADGLRADTCFQFLGRDIRYHKDGKPNDLAEVRFQASATTWPTQNTSFLRTMVEEKGSWGVSHTQVPTESRPGHVAMIAGFNEDVSAVTKGWQDNPVDFDHVFNQSSRTWAWGSPDITRMFSKRHSHVHDEYYSHEEEDFAAKDLTWLDTWVFNRVAQLFQDSKTNETLNEQLHQDQTVFFLHLLGIDSNGHAHRPHSPEYTSNMAVVDRGVSGIYHLFEEYFGDNDTAYLFTADHGMAAQGSHGDGDPSNTRTPVIAWGSGVSPPEAALSEAWINQLYETSFTETQERDETQSWGLAHLFRKDMQQADIAPLMSTLIGVPVPVNSVGMLPHSFIRQGRYRAQSSLVNAEQLIRQVRTKEAQLAAHKLRFQPHTSGGGEGRPLDEQLAIARETFETGDFAKTESICLAVFRQCREALAYYQTYDRGFLMTAVVLGYCGWIAYLFAYVTTASTTAPASVAGKAGPVLVLVITTGATLKLLLESSPVVHYLYVLAAGWFWYMALQKYEAVEHFKRTMGDLAEASQVLFYFVVLQLMVFGYTYRYMYAAALFLLSLWPIVNQRLNSLKVVPLIVEANDSGNHMQVSIRTMQILWAISCCSLGAFTFLPLDIHNSIPFMVSGAVLMVVFGGFLFWGPIRPRKRRNALWVTQLLLVGLALILALQTDSNLKQKKGLDSWNQALTFASFAVASVLPVFSGRGALERYMSVFVGLAVPFVLLSINFEVLFYAILGMTVLLWIILERVLIVAPKSAKRNSTVDDVRVAVMFLLFVHMAFFGTGNIASMSSFQLASTYRFLTVFSPFTMGGLLILKLMIPYTLVTALVRALARNRFEYGASSHRPSSLFLIVLALCDVMAVHLFFWVRNEGSWKEIGNSISQFGFINAQMVFIPFLFTVASVFMRGTTGELSLSLDKSK